MDKRIKIALAFACVVLVAVLAGCGFGFGSENTGVEIDPPQEEHYVEEGSELDEALQENSEQSDDAANEPANEESAAQKTVKRQLFLIDSNGMVVPQMIDVPVPDSKEVATQALEYLVKDGPVTEFLPNGFQAVLPAGTQVLGVNIKDGTAIADFSEEFKEYEAADELKILQAITWTLTQFDSIDRVKIRINGYDQNVMPVNGTPIGDGLSRSDGINIDPGNITDLSNSIGVTIYFLAQSGDSSYYVPVTKRVSDVESNKVAAIIQGLVEGPSLESGLFSDFSKEVELLDSSINDEGLLTLNFNEALLDNQKVISDAALNSLVLSLTEQNEIKEVAIQVNGDENVLTESGESLAQPVTRDTVTKTIGF